MFGFGKIFISIYDGGIVVCWQAMIVFQQFIILCDPEGFVDMTPLAISRRTGIPIDIIETGIEFLSKPDEFSRSKLHEGKRIILINEDRPWGWVIVNHSYYRNLSSAEDKREKDRKRIAEKRRLEKEAQTIDLLGESQSVADCSGESLKSPIQDTNTGSADADTETLSDPTGSEGNGKPPPCPQIAIKDAYHKYLSMCPRIRDWTSARQGYLRSRWLSDPERQNIEWWIKLFKYIAESDFLTGRTEGKNGSPPFIANLEWIVRPSNFTKIIEGNYHRGANS